MSNVIGRRGPKIDGLSRIRGQAVFTADMELPRMVHGAFARSPHPHARIVAIDVSEALAVPGVVGSMVGTDLPRRYGAIPVVQDETALALDVVRYVGEPVACIAAVDVETARRAARLVRVTYEVLPPVLGIDAALDPSVPPIHAWARKPSNILRQVRQEFGEVDAGMAAADLLIEGSYDYPGSTHVPLETHAALAAPDPDGKRLTLWTSTQNVHYVHRDVARVLGMDERDLRLVKPAVGAGYGGKCDPFCTELCAAHLARTLGRPVRIVLSREEVFYAHRGRHPTRMRLKMGLSSQGDIVAVDFKAWADGGAYSSYGVVTSYYLGVFMTMPYRMGAYRFEASRLYTNLPPCGPKRGHGAIQPRFALECHLDRAAAALGMDPAELRRRNLLGSDVDTLNGLRITSNGVADCLDAVLRASGWAERRHAMPPGRGLGLALSAYMSGASHGVTADDLSQSIVQVKVDRNGSVTVYSGSADLGQGSQHMLALVVAERLGLRPEQVRVVEADTLLTPVDLGSYSSRVTMMAGNAARIAADAVRAQLLGAVAASTGRAVGELDLVDGQVVALTKVFGAEGGHPSRSPLDGDLRGRGRSLAAPGAASPSGERSLPTLATLGPAGANGGGVPSATPPPAAAEPVASFERAVHLAEKAHGAVGAIGGFDPPKVGNRFRRQSVGPSPAYSFTAQVAEVEVDAETGSVRVVDVWVAHDCGRALNPTIVEGQVEGCVAMGVGEALFEAQSYRAGVHTGPSLLSYKTPGVHDTPPIHVSLVESMDAVGPFGAKECGEGPQLGTVPAIANALRHATGLELGAAPFTPEVVWRALRRRDRSAEGAS